MNKKNISAITNPMIKDLYHQLHVDKTDLIIIESWKIIKELLMQKQKIDYVLCTQHWYDLNKQLVDDKYITNLFIVSKEIIKKLSFVKSTNEIIVITKLIIKHFDIIHDQKYLILDNIQDPNNLATMIRTALCFNFKNIFISNHSVKLYNEKVVRGSMGAIFKIKVNYYDDLGQLIQTLNNKKITTIASCIDQSATKLKEYQLSHKSFCLIMGNEANGIDKKHIKLCKDRVFIDIKNMDSLNVACSFAILAFYLTK